MDIICSVGPKFNSSKDIKDYYDAGMTMTRFNFSHADYEKYGNLMKEIKINYPNVSIIQDLQGNKLRVSEHFNKEIKIFKNEKIIFMLEKDYTKLMLKKTNLQYRIIPVAYEGSIKDLTNVKYIFMKDATMRFKVLDINKEYILTITECGGIIRARKGINAPGIKRDGLSLTKKDKKDIKFGLKQGVDIICLSYVTSSNNIIELRRYLDSLNINTDNLKIWAKIECNEGYLNFNDILKVSDGIVLGRGDLKGEVPIDKIPIIEDKLINIMKKNNKPFVIATYILDSMAKSLVPSISEVNDIYKYSLNKVNGLMLSTELTRAKNPVYLLRYLNNLLKKMKDILEK
ncbi:pyruvate kinase [uncultured Clostridium sp.]|uniref:pyruvate kinase n=1 Tax=uncultured Clostridium sp. TaxID=59620 RepID=UPI0025F865EF|nr:pyruvate kinase [uncultured Clostridium sp.]